MKKLSGSEARALRAKGSKLEVTTVLGKRGLVDEVGLRAYPYPRGGGAALAFIARSGIRIKEGNGEVCRYFGNRWSSGGSKWRRISGKKC